MEETVTISKTQYDRLMESEDFLECLRAVGIDNWEGYYIAGQMQRREGEFREED